MIHLLVMHRFDVDVVLVLAVLEQTKHKNTSFSPVLTKARARLRLLVRAYQVEVSRRLLHYKCPQVQEIYYKCQLIKQLTKALL